MTFKEQYKHPKWQKKRLEILERDEYVCQSCCDSESTLHVHHYYYDKGVKVWEYENDVLVTFCENCHKKWHESKDFLDTCLCVDPYTLIQYCKLLELLSSDRISELIQYRAIIAEIKKIHI